MSMWTMVDRRARWVRLALLSALLGLAACDGVEDIPRAQDVLLAVGAHVGLSNAAGDQVLLFDGERPALAPRRLVWSSPAWALGALADGRGYALLGEEQALVLFDPGTGAQQVLPVGASYDRVDLDPAGDFLVLSFGEREASHQEEDIFFSRNRVAIVDLRAQPATVRPLTLQGPRPQAFRFLPALELPGRDPLALMAVFGDTTVTFVVLDDIDEDDRQRVVRLADPRDGVSLRVQSITAPASGRDGLNPPFYVSAAQVPLLYEISLLPGGPGTGRAWQPSINLLSLDDVPAQVHPFEWEGRAKLLVTGQRQRRVSVVDVPTSTLMSFPVDVPWTHAVLWDEVRQGSVRPTAVLYAPGRREVAFLDLDRAEAQGANALFLRQTSNPVQSMSLAQEGGGLLVATYGSATGDTSGLGVFRLPSRAEFSLEARQALVPRLITPERFFAAGAAARPNERPRLAWVIWSTEETGQTELPAAARRILALPGQDRLVVQHDADYGHVTFYNLSAPQTGPLVEWRGVFLEGLYNKSSAAPALGGAR